ncbi:hypothetical protein [Microbacterium paludicola]|uniref:hypothetical protein n=1 Tax=Microbacterium paludicola TaxID=300019 RepID=UPI0011A87FA2|nr:hypothetical protein [Microbacterium paludicola]
MYFSDLIRGLLRRWYVLLLGFALAGTGAYFMYDAIPVRYEANASMLLLPPAESVELQDGSNPYLLLGGLGQALAVLAERLNSQAIHEELVTDDTEYGVSGDTTSGAAFLHITTQADEERDALDLLSAVGDEAVAQLAAMQEELEITGTASIQSMPVVADVEATELSSTRLQLTLAVGAVGVVLTVIIAAAVEGIAATRARARAARNAPPPRERGTLEPLLASELTRPVESTRPIIKSPKRPHRTRTSDESVAEVDESHR